MNAQPSEEPEYRHWNLIYLIVIIYTVLLICALWLFSRRFGG